MLVLEHQVATAKPILAHEGLPVIPVDEREDITASTISDLLRQHAGDSHARAPDSPSADRPTAVSRAALVSFVAT